MHRVAVVTDTTHYMPAELIRSEGIHEVSLYVHWDGRQDREADLPDFNAFYDHLRTGAALPTTSQPSVGDFLAVYEALLDRGQDIVSIHLAGGLSGTCAAALQAKEQLSERGLGERIEVLDSETACGGSAMIVLAAAAGARAGEDLDGVVARTKEARSTVKIWFAIDTMEFLRRGGRVGAAAAWLGSALKIKPILSVQSQITPVERVRTAGRAFERMADYLQARKDDGADSWVVQHIQAIEQAERLAARGREIFGSDPLFVSEIGPVIGTHVGPGLLGVGGIPSRLLA